MLCLAFVRLFVRYSLSVVRCPLSVVVEVLSVVLMAARIIAHRVYLRVLQLCLFPLLGSCGALQRGSKMFSATNHAVAVRRGAHLMWRLLCANGHVTLPCLNYQLSSLYHN